jgi:NitT/TauT family transport system permease protein
MGTDYTPRTYRLLAPIGLLCFALIIWQLASVSNMVSAYVLPSPSTIIRTLLHNAPLLCQQTTFTLSEAILGFVLALALAVLVAVAVVECRPIDRALTPFLGVLQSIPVIAIAPILVVWFGPGLLGRILLAALIAFFPMVLNLISGFRSPEPDARMLISLFRASALQRYRYLIIPAAMPFVFSGLKTGAALSLVGAIVAELLVPVAGLGQVMTIAAYQFDTSLMFAAVTMSAASAMILVGILRLLEARVIFWHPSIRPQHDEPS